MTRPACAVVEVGPAAVVVAGEHEHLVDAAGRRLTCTGPEVAHRHRVVRRRRPGRGWARRGCASGRRGRRSRAPAAWPPRCPGRTGTGGSGRPRPGAARGAKSVGRSPRSATMVTHRPFSGLSRSWLIWRLSLRRAIRRHTDTCRGLSAPNGPPAQSLHRCSSDEAGGAGHRVELVRGRPADRPRAQAHRLRRRSARRTGRRPAERRSSRVDDVEHAPGRRRSTRTRDAVAVPRRGRARTPRPRSGRRRPAAPPPRRSTPPGRLGAVRLKNVLKAANTRANGPGGSSPAMSPTTTSSWSPPGLARSRATIAGGGVDAAAPDARRRERQGEPAGADAELEHRPVAGPARPGRPPVASTSQRRAYQSS